MNTIDNNNSLGEEAESLELTEILANIYQIATLNKFLPKEFKFESFEIVQKSLISASHDKPKKRKKVTKPNNDWSIASGSKDDTLVPSQPRKRPDYTHQMQSPLIDQGHLEDPKMLKRPSRERKPTMFTDIGYVDKDARSKFNKVTDYYKKCEKIIQALKKHHCSLPFLYPVDPRQYPDYPDMIKEPMDLSTVERKLKEHVYNNTFQVGLDIRKIWTNAFQYNPPNSDVYRMTQELSAHFEDMFREVGNQALYDTSELSQPEKKVAKPPVSENIVQKKAKTPQKAPSTGGVSNNTPLMEKPMNVTEKNFVIKNIRKLPKEQLRGVIEILNDTGCAENRGYLELDMNKLPVRKCRELERYVKQCLSANNKKGGAKPGGGQPAAGGPQGAAPLHQTVPGSGQAPIKKNGGQKTNPNEEKKAPLKRPSQAKAQQPGQATQQPLGKSIPGKNASLPGQHQNFEQEPQNLVGGRNPSFSSSSSSDSESSDDSDYNFTGPKATGPQQTQFQQKAMPVPQKQQPLAPSEPMMPKSMVQQHPQMQQVISPHHMQYAQQHYASPMHQQQPPQILGNPFQPFGNPSYQQPHMYPPPQVQQQQQQQQQKPQPTMVDIWSVYQRSQQQDNRASTPNNGQYMGMQQMMRGQPQFPQDQPQQQIPEDMLKNSDVIDFQNNFGGMLNTPKQFFDGV